ncbi:MAG: ABC transporter permease [Bacilli bacterium]
MEIVIRDGLVFALPLFIMALGGLFSERSGIINLSLEGLQGFGAFGAAFAAVYLGSKSSLDPSLIFIIAIVVAILSGMLLASLHALLCIKFKANQVISGVVINMLSFSLSLFLTKQLNKSIFNTPSDKFTLNVIPKIDIPILSKIPGIGFIFSNVYPFEIIIIIIALIMWYVLTFTRFGLHLQAAGDNPAAVDAAGGNVGLIRLAAILISGALSGLAGICFAYSISANFSSSIFVGYGYLAIAALIFGNWKIGPTLLACLIFAMARSGGYQLVQVLKLPSTYSDIIMILPYVLTLILLIFFSKHNKAPLALGEIYDKGKR